jgi:P27 family predicted phage terminase small subunit
MPAGRPRGSGQPTVLKVLKGGHPERINRDEPIPEEGIPDCPSKNPKVREVWDYTIRQLVRMRTITMADRDTLGVYCDMVVQYQEAADMVREDGAIIQGAHGPIRHPAVMVMNAAGTMVKNFSRDFGLNPAARSAIKVGDQRPKATESGASRLLSG